MSMLKFSIPRGYASPSLPGSSTETVNDYDAYAVTPNDGTDLPSGQVGGLAGTRATTAIYAAGAGTISVQLFGGGTAVLTLLAGGFCKISATRVLATGTSATGIQALY